MSKRSTVLLGCLAALTCAGPASAQYEIVGPVAELVANTANTAVGVAEYVADDPAGAVADGVALVDQKLETPVPVVEVADTYLLAPKHLQAAGRASTADGALYDVTLSGDVTSPGTAGRVCASLSRVGGVREQGCAAGSVEIPDRATQARAYGSLPTGKRKGFLTVASAVYETCPVRDAAACQSSTQHAGTMSMTFQSPTYGSVALSVPATWSVEIG